MNNLLITLLIFFVIYLISFNYRSTENFIFFDRTHTNYIKGLAILLIILSHMGGLFGIRYLTPLGGIGVAMFLICTGYGLTESYKKNGLKNYWYNKIKKVWVPYFLIQSIVTSIGLVFFLNNSSFLEFTKDILFIEFKHPFGWYMQFLFIWYAIFFVINKFKTTMNYKIIILSFISLILIFLHNQLWAEQALSVLTGIVLSNKKHLFKIKENPFISHGLILIGLFFLAAKQIDVIRFMPLVIANINQLLIKLPLAIGFIIFIYQKQILIKNNMLVYLGQNSFSLYLIHGYTIDILENPSFINIILFLLITILLSTLFDEILRIIFSINISQKESETNGNRF